MRGYNDDNYDGWWYLIDFCCGDEIVICQSIYSLCIHSLNFASIYIIIFPFIFFHPFIYIILFIILFIHVIYLLVEMRERVNEEVSKLEYCSPTGRVVSMMIEMMMMMIMMMMMMIIMLVDSCSDGGWCYFFCMIIIIIIIIIIICRSIDWRFRGCWWKSLKDLWRQACWSI